MIEFKLPALGADMDQGTLLEWQVKPGEAVKRGQVVGVVDTAKAAIDVEAWDEGVVHALVAQPGDVLEVGALMAYLRGVDETPEAAEAWLKAHPPKAAPAAAPALPPTAAPVTPAASAAAAAAAAPPKASPAARRRAADLHVDLASITAGTGPHGAISIEDVEAAAQTAAAPPDKAAQMRAAIAQSMSRSKREIPHYYLSQTIPLRHASDWLTQENARRPLPQRLLMAVVLIKAVAVTLRKFPDLNGFWRDGVFRTSGAIHAGIAISLRQGGLIAPAIHDADRLSLEQLMAALNDLVKRGRAGSLKSSEMSDPTVTITNLGDRGAESVFGVIFPPQVALVGFGRVDIRAFVEDGHLVAIPTVTASLAADHRVSDGHRGAQFLAALADILQQPESLA